MMHQLPFVMPAHLWRRLFSFFHFLHRYHPHRREEATDPTVEKTQMLSSAVLSLLWLRFDSFYAVPQTPHLGVKLQSLRRDGGDRDLLATLSHSPYNLLMLQQLYRLSVDLQQQISVLQARFLCRTAALQLTQDMDCYSHGH